MPVFIAGIYDHDVQLVMSLLQRCRIPVLAQDEAERLDHINARILNHLQVSIVQPEKPEAGWETAPYFQELKNVAQGIVRSGSTWVWGSPLNYLTIPFWHMVFPDAKFILCLRAPDQQAEHLFQVYFNIVNDTLSANSSVITHHDVYFYDPLAELSRLAEFLALSDGAAQCDDVSDVISSCTVEPGLAGCFLEQNVVSTEVRSLYENSVDRAGEVFQRMVDDRTYQIKQLSQVVKVQQDKLITLKQAHANELRETKQTLLDERERMRDELIRRYDEQIQRITEGKLKLSREWPPIAADVKSTANPRTASLDMRRMRWELIEKLLPKGTLRRNVYNSSRRMVRFLVRMPASVKHQFTATRSQGQRPL